MRLLAAICVFLLCAVGARAEVFHSRESALRLAFPGADHVEKRDVYLTEAQAARASAMAGSPLPSRLLTVYVGWKDGATTGYAIIDTHRVRTLPETVIVVVGNDWTVQGVHLLAFHEPPEYGPPAPWLRQFDGRLLDDRLALRGDVAGITGATITANSITGAVRRALSSCRVACQPEERPAKPASGTGTR